MSKQPNRNQPTGLTAAEVKLIVKDELNVKPNLSQRPIIIWATLIIALIGAFTGVFGVCNDLKYDRPMCRIIDIGCSSGAYGSPNRTAIILSCIIINEGKRPLFRKSISASLIFPDRNLELGIMRMPREIIGGAPGGGTIRYTDERDLTKVDRIAPTETATGDLLLIADIPHKDFYMKSVSIKLILTNAQGKDFKFIFPVDFAKGNSLDKNLIFPNSTGVITKAKDSILVGNE